MRTNRNFSTWTFACVFFLLLACNKRHETSNAVELIKIFDSNNDNILNPFEAMDMLLVLQQENGAALSIEEFEKLAKEYQNDFDEEIMELIQEYDSNGNGKVEVEEATGEMEEFIKMMDQNADDVITEEEARAFDFADALLASEEEIQERLIEIFEEQDLDKNGTLELSEIDEEDRDRYAEFDANKDEVVERSEAYLYMKADNTPVTFEVKGATAYMNGVITSELPAAVLQLLFENPQVSTIEMLIVPGSIDDEANLRAGLYIHQRGLTTKLNAYSAVASGGTDFFLSGKQRIVEQGATLGVHSWGGGSVAATEVPKDDPVHEKYLDFYRKVGVPEDFYWYTLEAAPADDIHIMTEEEIGRYNVRTE